MHALSYELRVTQGPSVTLFTSVRSSGGGRGAAVVSADADAGAGDVGVVGRRGEQVCCLRGGEV